MFYWLFEQLYLRAKVKIEEADRKRFEGETLPEGIDRTEGAYLSDGNPLHRFNLYKPHLCPAEKTMPLVIDIHGGGWICGDKDTNNNFCMHLAADGNVVAALSYRTIDCCTLREQIQDIFAFLHRLSDHTVQYGIDPECVFLTGDSAGAQLSLLAYCVNQYTEFQKLFSVTPVNFSFHGLILNHGVCYLNEAASIPRFKILSSCFLNPGLQRMLYGDHYSKSELYLHTVVPERYIFPSTELPPVLLITSAGDSAFSYQTQKLYDELKLLGKNCVCYCEEDASAQHVFNIADPDSCAGMQCNQQILTFIREHT